LEKFNLKTMGKGDKKTKRGKIVIGSSGVRRSRKKKRSAPKPAAKIEPVPIPEVEETPAVAAKEPRKKVVRAAETADASAEKPKTTRAKKKSEEPATPEPAENPVIE
jgi:ribosomal small subunit protein bTHX